jgi:hypothetical protein
MRGLICALFIGALLAVAHAVDRPDWAFPVADKIEPPSKDDSQPKTVTGSPKIAVLGEPFAGRELLEQRLVQPPRRPVVNVLDGRLAVAQLGAAQPN